MIPKRGVRGYARPRILLTVNQLTVNLALCSVLISSVLISGQVALAQHPLSQLDFDTKGEGQTKSPKATAEEISAILEDPGTGGGGNVERADKKPLKESSAPIASSKSSAHAPVIDGESYGAAGTMAPRSSASIAAGANSDGVGSIGAGSSKTSVTRIISVGPVQNFDWTRSEDPGAQYLVPLLKGPDTDKGVGGAITTVSSWKREGAACSDVSSRDGLCNKAKSIRELFRRFSGSNDFYDQQCQQTCADTNSVAVLTGLTVKAVRDGEFKMVDDKKTCRYKIFVRGALPRWQVLQGERGTCSCLPKSCPASF